MVLRPYALQAPTRGRRRPALPKRDVDQPWVHDMYNREYAPVYDEDDQELQEQAFVISKFFALPQGVNSHLLFPWQIFATADLLRQLQQSQQLA